MCAIHNSAHGTKVGLLRDAGGLGRALSAAIVGMSLSSALRLRWRKGGREIRVMESTVIYAFLVVACAPLIGIWRAHVWAKKNGFVLRKDENEQQEQTA